MIDLHCHVLPGIDDGPKTIDEALALARAAVDQGTRTIVATPHVNARFPNRSAGIAAATAALSERLSSEGIALELQTGAEIAMTSVDELDGDELQRLVLGDGRSLLLESPFTLAVDGFAALAEQLLDEGFGIVLAHPERCGGFQRSPQLLRTLIEHGALTSVTAGALVGRFGNDVRQFARTLALEGLVHNVASDAHDAVYRSPVIGAHLRAAGLRRLSDWLTVEVPGAIVDGGSIPPRPARGTEPADATDASTIRSWWRRRLAG